MSSQVKTTLGYYITPEKGVTADVYPATASNYRTAYDHQPVLVTDIRSVKDEEVSIDKQGFQLVDHVCSEKEWEDAATIKDAAYKETADLLKKITGASSVKVVSHIVRKERYEAAVEAAKNLRDREMLPFKWYAPNRYVHVDQSYDGAIQLLQEETPEDFTRLEKSRWAIINVWRPISQTVLRDNLAVCDARSVSESDLYNVTLHIPQAKQFKDLNRGKTFIAWQVTANPEHKWYYASKMTPEECLLIKIYDSKKDVARRVPHSAFVSERDEGPPRECVEIRCLVFWD